MRIKLTGKLAPCEVCAPDEHIKEENEETAHQTWIQGIHGHLLFQTSQQRWKQTLVDCGG